MDSEKVRIKLGISGTYFGPKRPKYRVLFNDQLIKDDCISAESDVVEYVEFEVEYDTEQAVLKVELTNKEPSDTVENTDKTGIVQDLLLNIHEVVIDDIELGQLIWEKSEYRPDFPAGYTHPDNLKVLTNCVNLGWNGTWSLTWSNPVYIWLLENM